MTCTADNTTDQVNLGVASAGADNATLSILANATVTRGAAPNIQIGQQGVVSVTNAGALGVTALPVGLTYVGTFDEPLNAFSLNNSGEITGGVSLNGVGGATTIENTGAIGGGIGIFGAGTGALTLNIGGTVNSLSATALSASTRGAIDAQISGTIGAPGEAGNPAILRDVALTSRQQDFESETSSTTVEGVTTTLSETTTQWQGSTVDLDLASGASAGATTINGVGSVSANIDGSIGNENDFASLSATSSHQNRDTQNRTVADGTSTVTTSQDNRQTAGGTSTITIGSSGSVAGNVTATGFAGASVTVDGSVGGEDTVAFVFASSGGTASTDDRETTTRSGGTQSSVSLAASRTGGEASIAIGESGSVSGQAFAQGDAGALVENAGAIRGAVTATSGGVIQSVNQSTSSSSFEVAAGEPTRSSSASSSLIEQASYGGEALVENSTTGVMAASASATGRAGATVNNAGEIGGAVNVSSTGTTVRSSSSQANSSVVLSDGTGLLVESNSSNEQANSTTQTGGAARLANAEGGVIGANPLGSVSVNITGTTGAALDNAGRINGNVTLNSRLSNTSFSSESSSSFTQDPDTLVLTSENIYSEQFTSTGVGGAADFVNGPTGLIVGNVSINADGGATVTNQGVVVGTTTVTSQFVNSTSEFASSDSSVVTPGDDGGSVARSTQASSFSNVDGGGDITGTYAGANGTVQFAPGSGARDGSVSQTTAGSSAATVTGAIFGNFTGTAQGSTRTGSNTFSQDSVNDADGDLISLVIEQSGGNETIANSGSSTLTVDGGVITGSAFLSAQGNAAANLVGGADIAGNLSVSTIGNSVSTSTFEFSEILNNDEDGALVDRTVVSGDTSSSTNGTGAASVTIADGIVGGSVSVNSRSGGSTLLVGVDGAVGSFAQVTSSGSDVSREFAATSVTTPDGAGTTTQTDQTLINTSVATGGNVSARIDGVVGNSRNGAIAIDDAPIAGLGGLSLFTSAGDATATLTGQVSGSIDVFASGTASTSQSTSLFVNNVLQTSSSTSASTAVGGTASLTVNSSAENVAARNPANFGGIFVAGVEGSTVTIAANSTVMAARGGASMQVGALFNNSTSSGSTDNTARTQTNSFANVLVGGPATLTVNGTVGNNGGNDFDGASSSVLVTSITRADAVNNGSIFGSLTARSIGTNFGQVTNSTNVGDVTQVNVVDRTYTAVGGTASIDNNRLITGSVAVAAASGALSNDGVIRGGANFGQSVANYTTLATDTATALGEEEVTGTVTPFAQSYTVAQNGLLGGGISVGGAFSPIDDELVSSNIAAAINLNTGSVTVGNIVGEFDQATGERFTRTTVALNGAGYLGLTQADAELLEGRFATFDPRIAQAGDLREYVGTTRVLGADSLTKTGAGTFKIFGAAFAPVGPENAIADYTVDVGEFRVSAGEVQLAVAPVLGERGVFGIRGNVTNSGSLVLGQRVTLEPQLFANNLVSVGGQAIDGVAVYQNGNFAQTGTGTLVVGMAPALVRLTPQSVGTGTSAPDILGFGQVGVSRGFFTTLENVSGGLGSSFVTIDGNLSLQGTVNVVAPRGGIFTGGQTLDLFSVSGTVTENATVNTGLNSAFVTFDLTSRVVAGRTVVSLAAARRGYDTAGLTDNGRAAGAALSASIPSVVTALTADATGTAGFTSVGEFGLTQDLATVISGFDSLLNAAQAGAALEELASGEFYGSLMALETTAPFADAITNRLLPVGAEGFNLWIQPSGDFTRFDGDATTGSRKIKADNFGGSAGFGVATGNGEFGLGFGYGRINVNAPGEPISAKANTYMVGAFARFGFDAFTVAADAVYGWSDWETTRELPTFARTAEAEFDSKEFNANLRAEYRFDFDSVFVAPFAQANLRKYDFDGFAEEGAGAIGLLVEDAGKTVFTPEVGLQAGTSFETGLAVIRPELTLSYAFQGNPDAFRNVSYLGAPGQTFRLQGVDPDGYFLISGGLFADIGRGSSAFVGGSYGTGGGNDRASISAGVRIGF